MKNILQILFACSLYVCSAGFCYKQETTNQIEPNKPKPIEHIDIEDEEIKEEIEEEQNENKEEENKEEENKDEEKEEGEKEETEEGKEDQEVEEPEEDQEIDPEQDHDKDEDKDKEDQDKEENHDKDEDKEVDENEQEEIDDKEVEHPSIEEEVIRPSMVQKEGATEIEFIVSGINMQNACIDVCSSLDCVTLDLANENIAYLYCDDGHVILKDHNGSTIVYYNRSKKHQVPIRLKSDGSFDCFHQKVHLHSDLYEDRRFHDPVSIFVGNEGKSDAVLMDGYGNIYGTCINHDCDYNHDMYGSLMLDDLNQATNICNGIEYVFDYTQISSYPGWSQCMVDEYDEYMCIGPKHMNFVANDSAMLEQKIYNRLKYDLHVFDMDGNPVSNAIITFYDDPLCMNPYKDCDGNILRCISDETGHAVMVGTYTGIVEPSLVEGKQQALDRVGPFEFKRNIRRYSVNKTFYVDVSGVDGMMIDENSKQVYVESMYFKKRDPNRETVNQKLWPFYGNLIGESDLYLCKEPPVVIPETSDIYRPNHYLRIFTSMFVLGIISYVTLKKHR